MAVTMTERAAQHVADFLREAGQGGRAAAGSANDRVFGHGVQAGVCRRGTAGGIQSFECHGVKILIDPKSLAYIDGTELDFVREGLNEGFRLDTIRMRRTAAAAASPSISRACSS